MRPRGFTFLEILIVVALVSAFVMVVGSRIGGGFGIAITSSARVISAELRHAKQRAIATGQTHRWVIDLESQAFRLEQLEVVPDTPESLAKAVGSLLRPPRSSSFFEPVNNSWGGWRWLDDEEVAIEGVQTRDGRVEVDAVSIAFAPDGGADAAVVELSDEHGNRLGIQVDAFTGSIRTLEEDQLDDYELLDLGYGEQDNAGPDQNEDEIFERPPPDGAEGDATL